MCLPLQCLRFVVSLSAIMATSLGSVSIVTGLVLYLKAGGQYSGLYNIVGNTYNYQTFVTSSLIIFGIILLIIGLFGIIGGLRKSHCCLAVFNCGIILIILIFFNTGVLAYIYARNYGNDTLSQCPTLEWSQEFYLLSSAAQAQLCKEDCECYIMDPLDWPKDYLQNSGISNYTVDPQLTTVIAFQSCPGFQDIKSSKDSTFLSTCESLFNCAGWCTPSPIYLFTDVNNGPPPDSKFGSSCFSQYTQWMHDHGNTAGAICLTITSVLILNLILTCCLCFHPHKKHISGNIYQRMVYYDNE